MNLASDAFERLSKEPNAFINMYVDNWRGWRFIFDTEEVRNCNNDCRNCKLYNLLKNEKEGIFSAGLYPANQKDKKLFGGQNFLNCKTLEQYIDCYVNFLLKEANTEREIREELNLIRNFRIIFSRETDDLKKKENEFRRSIIKKISRLADKNTKIKILNLWKKIDHCTTI
jgi:hypothetical protein